MMQSMYGAIDPLALAMLDPLFMSGLPQKDNTFTKIFVGGLPYHSTDKVLREYFEQFGDIEEAVVITDRQTGKSKGYGFVTMKESRNAERACKEPNPIIDGRKANVNLAYLGAKPRNNNALQLAGLPLPLTASLPMMQNRMNLPAMYVPANPLVSPSPTGLMGLPQMSSLTQNHAQAQFFADYQNLALAGAYPALTYAPAPAQFYDPYQIAVSNALQYPSFTQGLTQGVTAANYAATFQANATNGTGN